MTDEMAGKVLEQLRRIADALEVYSGLEIKRQVLHGQRPRPISTTPMIGKPVPMGQAGGIRVMRDGGEVWEKP